jgi:glycosyltransferase involved in cell wall biosynthesis
MPTGEARRHDRTVSVVVAHRNTNANFVSECMASIDRQTYPKPAIELIVVDDASTAESLESLKKEVRLVLGLEKHVIELSRHSGPGAALNTGIGVAQGEYIFILDSDDVIEPDAIAQCVAAARFDAALVYTDNARWDTALTRPLIERRKALFHAHHCSHKATIEDPLLHLHFVHFCQLYRREALEAVDGYRAGLSAGGDYDLNLRIAGLSTGVNFAHVPRLLHRYRVNPAGITRTRRLEQIADTRVALADAYERWGFGRVNDISYIGKMAPGDHSYFTPVVNGRPMPVSWADLNAMQLREWITETHRGDTDHLATRSKAVQRRAPSP